MTSLARQLEEMMFRNNTLLDCGLRAAMKFLSLSFDVCALFDNNVDTAIKVECHVTGDNRPPVAIKSTKVLRGELVTLHPDINASPTIRQKIHDISSLTTIRSLTVCVVNIDKHLAEQLKEAKKNLSEGDVRLQLYTAISYLYEVRSGTS